MLQTLGQWLAQNALWLTAVAAVLAVVEWVLKPFRWIASFHWSPIKRQSKPGTTLPSAHLTFVAIPSQCRCALGKDGKRVMTQIDTDWHVTNAPVENHCAVAGSSTIETSGGPSHGSLPRIIFGVWEGHSPGRDVPSPHPFPR